MTADFFRKYMTLLENNQVTVNTQGNFDAKEGDTITDTVLGDVQLIKVTDTDMNGQFAEGIVKTATGKTYRVSYEALVGNDEPELMTEIRKPQRNLVKYDVYYDLVDDPKTGKIIKVYKVIRLEAKPDEPNFYAENPKTIKKGIMKRAEAEALADQLNAREAN